MLITLASASGSPGVSTTALGLALTWNRDVILIEADPIGASPTLSGFFSGQIAPQKTILDLTAGEDLEEQLFRDSIPLTDEQEPMKRVVPAVANPLHGRVLARRWPELAPAFADLERAGIDVIADLGRTGTEHFAKPLYAAADVSALVIAPTIGATLAARSALAYTNLIEENPLEAPAFHLITIETPHGYSAAEVSRALGHPSLGTLPDRPKHAASLAHGAPRPRGYDNSSYVRSLRSLGNAISNAAQARRTALKKLRGETP